MPRRPKMIRVRLTPAHTERPIYPAIYRKVDAPKDLRAYAADMEQRTGLSGTVTPITLHGLASQSDTRTRLLFMLDVDVLLSVQLSAGRKKPRFHDVDENSHERLQPQEEDNGSVVHLRPAIGVSGC